MVGRMKWNMAKVAQDRTSSQYVTMKKLATGTAGVTELARAAEVNPGAMTRLLDRLEAKGLVARTADPTDRRALNIHLTESGLAIWQDINKCGERVRERALAGMSEEERSVLTQLLERARDNLISTES